MRILFILIAVPCLLLSQWSVVTGPGLTNITAMAKQGDALIVGTSTQGIFRTTDRGDSWNSLNGTMANFAVNSLFGWDTLLLAGITAGSDKGLYQGYLGGKSWKKFGSPFSNNAIVSIVRIDTTIFAASTSTVFRSTDRGVTWTSASSGITAGNVINALAVNGTTLVAATAMGIFRTTDLGASWIQTRTNTLYTELSTSISASNGKIYVTNQNGGVNAGKDTVYRSTDNGVTWVNVKNNLPSSVYGQYVMAYGDTVFYGMAGDGIYRSTNAGQSWQVDTVGLWNKRTISGFIDGNVLYSGASSEYGGNGGLYVSTNGGNTWTKKFHPLSTGVVNDMQRIGNAILVSYNTATDRGVFRSVDGGRSWQRLSLTVQLSGMTVKGSRIFAGAFSSFAGGLMMSADSGATWNPVNTGLPTATTTFYNFALDGDTLYAGLKEGLYRSTDNGTNWVKWGTGIAASNIYDVAVKGDTMYACNGTTTMYRSLNRGRTWTTLKANASLNRIDMIGDVFYGFGGTSRFTVYTGKDTGATWTALNNTALGTSVAKFFAHGNNLIAMADGKGALYSTNSGSTWTAFNTGLYKSASQVLVAATVLGDTIFTALSDGGIARRATTESGILSVKQRSSSAPSTFMLEQNFPNPFNPSTTIRFSVPVASTVTLEVFDVIGRRVATLANGWMQEGTYSVRFDGTGLSSGLYLYRISAANVTQTKKMMLMK